MSNKALDYLNKVDFEGAFDLSKIPAGERDLWEQRAKLMLHYRDLVFQRIADNKPVADVLKELKAISTTDPKYYKVYTKWAKENKLVPHTEAHHKFGVNKNSLTALGIKPHQLRDQHLYLQDFDIHLGNNPFNREYLSRLAHTGSRLIAPGKPGSMEASAHPGGTKIIDAELTSTKPKARAEEIARLNEGAIQAAQTAVLSDQQFREAVNDIVSETRDVQPYVLDKTGILVPNNGSIKFDFSPKEVGLIKQLSRNPHFYEFNAGLGTDAYQQLKRLPKSIKPSVATTVGLDVLSDNATQEAILKGDYNTAATRLGTSAVVGKVAGSALRFAPAVARVVSPAAAVTTGAALFQQGQRGSFLDKAANKASTVVPGLKPNPKTDLGKAAWNELKYIAGSIRFSKLPYTP